MPADVFGALIDHCYELLCPALREYVHHWRQSARLILSDQVLDITDVGIILYTESRQAADLIVAVHCGSDGMCLLMLKDRLANNALAPQSFRHYEYCDPDMLPQLERDLQLYNPTIRPCLRLQRFQL